MAKKMIWGRELEYIISYEMYENLKKEAPAHVNIKDWIIDYINQDFNLLGTVTTLQIEGKSSNYNRQISFDEE